MAKPVCAVVGIGPGNGAALARRFAAAGYAVALMSRQTDLSGRLAAELEPAPNGRPAALESHLDLVDRGGVRALRCCHGPSLPAGSADSMPRLGVRCGTLLGSRRPIRWRGEGRGMRW